ncbi:MAG: hypothetical protein AAFQ66_10800, partial [Pseudomonadota bacterium]
MIIDGPNSMPRFMLSHILGMLVSLLIATHGQAEPVSLGYLARVEPVMLDPDSAGFDCALEDRPALLEIKETTLGTIFKHFPATFLHSPVDPIVRIRRGNMLVPTRPVAKTPLSLRHEEWDIMVSGKIGVCAGPETLKIAQGSLKANARLGSFRGNIIPSDNVVQDFDVEYQDLDVDRLDDLPAGEFFRLFFYSKKFKTSLMHMSHTGQPPPLEGYILGRLEFDAPQLEVRYKGEGEHEDVTHLTHLNVSLILMKVDPVSD